MVLLVVNRGGEVPQQPERDLPLHRGLARLLAKQRNPVLKVVLPARGHELQDRPAVFLVRNQEQAPAQRTVEGVMQRPTRRGNCRPQTLNKKQLTDLRPFC